MKKFASPCSTSRSPGTGRRVPSLRNALWMMIGVALAAEAAFASPREKVLFDTDIGGDPDDGLALVYLLKEPRCELLGVTTVGGCPDRTARVASAPPCFSQEAVANFTSPLRQRARQESRRCSSLAMETASVRLVTFRR